jgi:endonuclease YncB( thermonuclease family)
MPDDLHGTVFTYPATVTEVVDGDTMKLTAHARASVGLDVVAGADVSVDVRLLGCNAPEKSTPEGRKARAWVEEWVRGVAGGGTDVTLTTYKTRSGTVSREKYGRLLGLVSVPGHDLVTELIASGNAVAWDGRGARPDV